MRRRTGTAPEASSGQPAGSDRPDARDVEMDSGRSASIKPARSPGELAQSDSRPGAAGEEQEPDSALESLGKAVSEPVRDGADDKPGRRHGER